MSAESTDDLSRFNVYVRYEYDMPEFDAGFLKAVQTRHRHGTTQAVVMSADAWKDLEPLSLVPIANCTNIVVTGSGVPSTSTNGVCHVGTLTAALRACAAFQAVDMAFVIGDLVLEASTHFTDGIDYVYVQAAALTATALPWYCDAEHFECLTKTAPSVYGGHTRNRTLRTLTPWVIQQLDGEHDQAQYNRVLATVIRSGVFESSASTYTQAGIRLHFSLTNAAGQPHIPVLQTVSNAAGINEISHPSVTIAAAKKVYEDRFRALHGTASSLTETFIKELGAHPYFCISAGSMACTVVVTTGTIDAVVIATVALAVHVEARRLHAIPCHITFVYPIVTVPAQTEAQCFALIAANRTTLVEDTTFIDVYAATPV